jgi:hypothetical protein
MYNNILITSEVGWDVDVISRTVDYIFHEKLHFSDTYSKIKEFVKTQKKKQEEKYSIKREENKLLRAQRKLEKKNKKQQEDSEASDTETQFNKNYNLISKQLNNLKKFNYIEEKNKVKQVEDNNSNDKFELNDVKLYIRDRKTDINLRNVLVSIGYTIVQFRSEWDKKPSAGIDRNNTIFGLNNPPDLVIIFTKWSEEHNGIDHIIHMSHKKNTPILIIDNDEMELKSFNPVPGIDTAIIDNVPDKEIYIEKNDRVVVKHTIESLNNKIEETEKKMKSLYSKCFLERPGTKLITQKDL